MTFLTDAPTGALTLGLATLMFAGNELGFRLGLSQRRDETESSRAVSNALKGSIVGLVAFLLGFTFSMTTSRHDLRRKVVLDEANSIGTCHLRAGLVAEPEKTIIRKALREYVDARLEYFDKGLDPAEVRRAGKHMDRSLRVVWTAVEEVSRKQPEMLRTSQLVPATNDVIDQGGVRSWAVGNHIPAPVMALLMLCVVVSCTLLGHSSGQSGRRHAGLWSAFNILLAMLFFLVLDFDRPRRGLIQVDHTPLLDLKESLDQGP